jgi:hypothetical protein
MNPNEPIKTLKAESTEKGKDPGTRKILLILFILWIITLISGGVIAWNAYFNEKAITQSLALRIAQACASGDFGPGISDGEEDALCHRAEKIADDKTISLGIEGPRGPRGPEGPEGPMGPQGLYGHNGADGKNGRNGLNGLIGPPGPMGANGKDGIDGKDGTNGKDGLTGPPGVVQVTTIGCEGPIIHEITADYDPVSQTITIQCN